MSHLLRIAASAATIVAAAVPSQAANLIKNSSFEFPATPSGSYIAYSTGQTFDHWLVVGAAGNVATVSTNFSYCAQIAARKGNASLDLTGTSNTATGVQQTIATTPGATYSLSFAIGNIVGTGNCGTTSTVEVLIDGENVASFTNKANGGSVIAWRRYSTQFVAQSAQTTIALMNGDPPSDTANGLDAVSVTYVSGP